MRRRTPSLLPAAVWLALIAAVAAAPGCGSAPEPDPDRPRESPAKPQRPAGDRGDAEPGGARPAGPARARLAGAERLVFIGDSLAVAGELPYPSRLGGLLERPVEVANLAEAGTTSADWLPGRPLFEQRLRPALADADVVFVSVGGNDLEDAVLGLDGLDALERAGDAGALAAIGGAFEDIERNLGRTFTAIERQNPDAAIVFVGYPDYSASPAWRERGGLGGTIALRAGLEAFDPLARNAGAEVTLDLLDATAPRIDSLLSDGEHLSDAGHELYAKRLAGLLDP